MKLILDFGNSLKKFALFDGNQLIQLQTKSNQTDEDLIPYTEEFLKNYANANVKDAVISSVINYPASYSEYLRRQFSLLEIDENTPLPIRNEYGAKSTLGKDRLANAVAAHTLYPGKAVLVITTGTCTTYDFVNAEGEYLGGAISPGINMRFKALHNFTDHLPLEQDTDFNQLIGTTTRESILSGVINGMAAEMDGMIDRYMTYYENLTVILSGGDHKRFDKKLKNSIFAIPFLVLTGLNIILEFNEKK